MWALDVPIAIQRGPRGTILTSISPLQHWLDALAISLEVRGYVLSSRTQPYVIRGSASAFTERLRALTDADLLCIQAAVDEANAGCLSPHEGDSKPTAAGHRSL